MPDFSRDKFDPDSVQPATVAGHRRSILSGMRLARVLGALGRGLISAGVIVLLFVAYELGQPGWRPYHQLYDLTVGQPEHPFVAMLYD